jgi:DNA-binding response OmpR family regulator
VLAFSGNRIDFRAMRAECRDGQTVDLTQSEARLLRLLAGHAGGVVLRKNVVEHVFGRNAAPTVRTLDNVVLRLRKLLEPDPAQPRHLLTVRGLGFRFEP